MGVSYWPSLSATEFQTDPDAGVPGRFLPIGFAAELSLHALKGSRDDRDFYVGGDFGFAFQFPDDGVGYALQFAPDVELDGYVTELLIYVTPSIRWTFRRNSGKQFYVKLGAGYYRSALEANAFFINQKWVSHRPGSYVALGFRVPTERGFAWESDVQVHAIAFGRPELFADESGLFKFPLMFRTGFSFF